MSMERAKYMGHRVQIEQELQGLKVRINGTIEILRDKLDPLLTIEALDTESIPVHALELHDLVAKYRAGQERLHVVNGILGE